MRGEERLLLDIVRTSDFSASGLKELCRRTSTNISGPGHAIGCGYGPNVEPDFPVPSVA